MENSGEIMAKLDAILAELTGNKDLTEITDTVTEETPKAETIIEEEKPEEVITDTEQKEANDVVEKATSEDSQGGEEVTEEEADEVLEYLDL